MPANSSLGQYLIESGRVINLPNYNVQKNLPSTDSELVKKASLTIGSVDWVLVQGTRQYNQTQSKEA